ISEDLLRHPHVFKSSPTRSPSPLSPSTKTFLIGEPVTPFILPTPLLPPPTNTHLHETTPEAFTLLTTYFETSTYNPPAHLPLASKLECHITLYDLSTEYEIPGLVFHVLARAHAMLALLIPHDCGYSVGPARISCCEKWSLVRLVYGCGGGGGFGRGFRRRTGGDVKSGLVDGRIGARSDVSRALEEVHRPEEDLLVALGARGWPLPPFEGGVVEGMGQQLVW
ncbi:hypothetical protein HOY80DRAFT_961188, partial [Tuber brumale]